MALGLVGHARMHRMMAVNKAYNHAGNIASALLAMVLVAKFDVDSVFAALVVVSIVAAASCLLIRPADLQSDGRGPVEERPPLRLDRELLVLTLAVALFHLANAPAMPLVALEVKALHGTDAQVAAVVFVAQCVMVPMAWACGPLAGRFGRKWVFAVGFVALPLRLVAYTLVGSPSALVLLQSLDGIGTGDYGVLIAATCSDLAQRGHGFTTLMGITATAQALGGFLGPLLAGALLQHLGFAWAFLVLAAIAALAALVYLAGMPETARRAISSLRT
jgi:MFS family permease